MPAWIAGIQVRKDASGDIHVNLDCSTPCWNDARHARWYSMVFGVTSITVTPPGSPYRKTESLAQLGLAWCPCW